ncbi:hypothetical protein M9H77_08600 [Catharanthus roseus]|uniref:Uncharacterized protein n=1 Tax=Catharanthus roseus TaxID=4058 RepID=A0ACC0BYC3_CATRO|nr:hypothetical protein M9H77_08600 [Catharanthus roseus]
MIVRWKDPILFKFFLDLCLKEVNKKNFSGGSLEKEAWERIRLTIEKELHIELMQKQLKNQWDYLKRKYNVWIKIVGKTGNSHWDSVSNTINWTNEQWNDYIKHSFVPTVDPPQPEGFIISSFVPRIAVVVEAALRSFGAWSVFLGFKQLIRFLLLTTASDSAATA